MTDKERFQKIIAEAGFQRNIPGSMARILVENGATFLDVHEMDYCNGKAAMRQALIEKLTGCKEKVRGANRAMLGEVIRLVENLEVN